MANQPASQLEPVVPDTDDIDQARQAIVELNKLARTSDEVVIEDRARRMHAVLPEAAVRLLQVILREMAQGHAMTLVPIHAELTTQEAADAINVSRPFLVKLLETGALPHRKVGTHRRVRYEDLMRYKRLVDAERSVALKRLTAESQRLGLYD